MVSFYICEECEDVNISILKDGKKVNSQYTKNVKRKIIVLVFSVASFILFLMTEGTSGSDTYY